MAKYVSRRNPVSVRSLKRRAHGTVIARHFGRVDIRFTRVDGGWLCERTDFIGLRPVVVVVSSASVARECNGAVGCQSSWAKVY